MTLDTTKNQEAKDPLEEDTYKTLVNNATEAIFIAQKGMLKLINPATCKITGRTYAELYSTPFLEFVHPEDRELIALNYEKRISGQNAPERYQFRIVKSNGDIIWAELSSVVYTWEGQPATLNFLTDITERKAIENALIESEKKYKKIFENIQDIFYQTDLSGTIIELSPSIHRYAGFTREELIGKPVTHVYSNPEKRAALVKTIMEKGEVIDYEVVLKDKFGNEFYTSTNSHILYDSHGNIIGIEGSLRDISERKKTEIALKESIKQKEILMVELQHRVKNNLGIISSLLSLELSKLKDDYSKEIFLNARNRIFSMATIYEHLYSSGNLNNVNLSIYLKDLANMILQTFSLGKGQISLQTTLDEIYLDLRKTVPLGLILNELITNSIKYAFTHTNNDREIKISLSKHSDKATLHVSDNGKGLPENFDIKKSNGMGLNLVLLLVEQIEGSIDLFNSNGANIVINFRI
jgi:PAS domain S-box-containing protein